MTFIWLIVWLCEGTPAVGIEHWNAWGVSLVVCLALDLLNSGGRRA